LAQITSPALAATTGTVPSPAQTTTTAPAPAAVASSPKVTITPTGSGKGATTTIAVGVSGCPTGAITITDTVNNGTQSIAGNGKPATVVSHGTPGTYTITATCTGGSKASAQFMVTKAKGPSVTLSPSSTGPVPKTIKVAVQGCPPGAIKITDTINDGSQTIKKDGAPATIPSPGTPGKYTVTAKCSADAATAHAGFLVKKGPGPEVKLHPSTT